MKVSQKGFTLIELLVVIAIIGMLSAVILASLNSARTKAADAAIKGNLSGIRSSANVIYDTLGGKYSQGVVGPGDCATVVVVTPPTQIAQDSGIHAAMANIKQLNGNVAISCYIDAAGAGYAFVTQLKSGGYICLDGTGQLKTTTGTSANNYDSVTGGTYPALASVSSTFCN